MVPVAPAWPLLEVARPEFLLTVDRIRWTVFPQSADPETRASVPRAVAELCWTIDPFTVNVSAYAPPACAFPEALAPPSADTMFPESFDPDMVTGAVGAPIV